MTLPVDDNGLPVAGREQQLPAWEYANEYEQAFAEWAEAWREFRAVVLLSPVGNLCYWILDRLLDL